MRNIILLGALALFPWTLLAYEPDDSILKLVGKDWTIVKEDQKLTLIRRNVRVLYLVSLPGLDSDFKEFGFDSDYRITISHVPKLSDKEYDLLKQVRDQVLAERLKGRDPKTKEYYVNNERDLIMPLPQYYDDRHAIRLYSSYAEAHEFEQADVRQTLKAIRELLDKKYQKYEQPAK